MDYNSYRCLDTRHEIEIRPFPTKRVSDPDFKRGPFDNFVGNVRGRMQGVWLRNGPCPKECRFFAKAYRFLREMQF